MAGLVTAERFLEEARREFARSQAERAAVDREMYKRQSAEKAFNAFVQAVDDLLRARGRTPPEDETAHATRRQMLEEESEFGAIDAHARFATILHGDGFYFGRCAEDGRFARLLDEVEQAVRDLRQR